MTATVREALRQRADYTHTDNLQNGRHGWLRLTPAYSVKIVEELIGRLDGPHRIFDPFAGTATTALCAAYHGHEGVTLDVNPFLVWLGQSKTAHYRSDDIATACVACERALGAVESETVQPAAVPPIYNIGRWWDDPALHFLRCLRAAIDAVTEPDAPERSLLLVAFCRTLVKCSSAAFDHQSMSFNGDGERPAILPFELREAFERDLRFVLRGAAENPRGSARVLLGDARNPSAFVEGSFDLVVTSPPYANRMSYIRELRPYMYWLGYLSHGRDAGELDWSAIGGTWGIATSRLADWRPGGEQFTNDRLETLLDRIADQTNKSGRVLANYVARYVDDIWAHFRGLRFVLASGAELHYIVGNSSFYGVLVPVEEIYAEMLDRLGFEAVTCRPLRKRNSKKELIEFDVTARWPG
jgi:hypothetical protein